MALRKDRRHTAGVSNLDFRTSRPSTSVDYNSEKNGGNRIDFLSTAKPKNFDELLKEKQKRVIKPPLDETVELYNEVGKKKLERTNVSQPRTAQLEEKDKRKLAFTGESELIYDKNMEKYNENFKHQITMKPSDGMNRLIKDKHNTNATAQQETQLIGLDKYALETLKNNVDLEKVREVRRAIRRRYAARKNIQKIYNSWDEDHTGYISVDNILNMMKRLGLNLNKDEARVLISTADKDMDNKLSLDEFLDLVFNKDDKLNVDLESLAKKMGNEINDYKVRTEEIDKGDNNLLKILSEDARKARETKHINQINLLLKNRLNELAMNLINSDYNKKGYLTFEKFEENIRKLGINENILTDKDIKSIFEKNKSPDHNINYKDFIQQLRDFQFVQDNPYSEFKTQGTESARLISEEFVKESWANHQNARDQITISDCRSLPYHQILNYFKKSRRYAAHIRRFFPDEEALKNYTSKVLSIDKSNLETHNLSKEELKNYMIKLFGNFDNLNITKFDHEGFLSSFVYNQQGYLNFQDFLYGVYKENDKEYFEKISQKKKGRPPHKSLTEIEELPPIIDDVKTPENEILFNPRSFNKTDGFKMLKNFSKPRDLNEVLRAIDDKIFNGTVRAYEVFKKFDIDGDGYISHKDIAKKMEEMCLVSKDEMPGFLNYLDPENKGYVVFNEFHKKIRSNLTQQDEDGNSTVLPYMAPSKRVFEKVAKEVPETKKKVEELKKLYSSDIESRPATRFGSTPTWKNTFLNFQSESNSAMFISENERLSKDTRLNTFFQVEDREKRKIAENAKINCIKTHQDFFKQKIGQEQVRLDSRESSRLAAKNMAQTFYQHKANLLNAAKLV